MKTIRIPYKAIHAWLRDNFCPANKCENENCNHKSKTYVWAKLKDKEYDFKRENFWMLCRSCHTEYDMTDEWRSKLSEASIGENNGMYGNHNKRKPHTEEAKEKISKANTGENNPNYGKTTSKETKEKISIANTGQKRSEETKKKMSKAWETRIVSEETKLKMSIAKKEYWKKYWRLRKKTNRCT